MGRRRTQASERDPSLSTMTLARGATLRLVGWPGAARARRLLAQRRGPLPPTHDRLSDLTQAAMPRNISNNLLTQTPNLCPRFRPLLHRERAREVADPPPPTRRAAR
jgi:hypothetical protein